MKMSLRTKLILLCVGLGVFGLSLLAFYLRGRKVGVATANVAQVANEVKLLEDDKVEIQKAVHALDTDALRHHIIDLSSRVHEQASRRR